MEKGMTELKGPKAAFVPTETDRKVVSEMAANGLAQTVICRAVINPATETSIGVSTLCKRFARELKAGRAKAMKRRSKQKSDLRYTLAKTKRPPGDATRCEKCGAVKGESQFGKVVIYIPDNGSGLPPEGATGKLPGESG